MKAFFCIVLAIAAASAESDPNLVYTDGVFHTNAANLAKGVHTQYTAGRVGSLYNVAPSYYNAYSAYNLYNPYRIYKREAESEPEADPALLVSPYRAGYVSPVGYSAGYVSPYTTYNAYNAYNLYNPYRIYKREAESEPEADPALLVSPYRAGYVSPVGYSAGYVSPYTTYNAYNAYNLYNPYRLYKREAESEPEADPALLVSPYRAGYVSPVGYSAGYVSPYTTYNAYNAYNLYNPYRLYKREAEAESDPAYVAYSGIPYASPVYRGVYSSVYNRPLTYASAAYTTPYRYFY